MIEALNYGIAVYSMLIFGLALWTGHETRKTRRLPVRPEPAEPAMPDEHARVLAALVGIREHVAPAARANGSILADELRRLDQGSDHAIAVLLLELAIFSGGLERRESCPADRWRVLTDSMAMAAIDLTELDRVTL